MPECCASRIGATPCQTLPLVSAVILIRVQTEFLKSFSTFCILRKYRVEKMCPASLQEWDLAYQPQ